MSRARTAAGIAAAAIAAASLLGTGVLGSGASPRAFASERLGFEGELPPGWHVSRARLVPLPMPREILSVGTFPMPVGGGGNCGREPAAAIERMPSGGALVTLQEYAVSTVERSRIGTAAAPPPLAAAIGELALRRAPEPRERSASGEVLRSATLPFTDHGRWFDALVYVRGDPTRGRMRQVRAILRGLRFRAV